MKDHIHTAAGILSAFCLMFILLITSVEAVCYWTPGYFEKEYTKYAVLDRLPAMTMEDLLTVTDEMMDYLKGDREDLHVQTTMGGEEREFFTEREIAHMEDVQGLFLASIALRRLCIGFILLSVCGIFLTKGDLRTILPRTTFFGTLLFFGAAAVLGLIVSTDFSRYFIVFHHIFFDNDLWILDPSVDMLINIVPEGFFSDTAFRILMLYGLSALLVLFFSFVLMKKDKARPSRPRPRLLSLCLSLCLICGLFPLKARAEGDWPMSQGIQADGGILIDADSGTVLFEKNADQRFYPASITKILTALIIIENCDMNDMVTFSDNAVNNVESNSSNMAASPGDQLTVRDCLYGLMLASANEAANALAEHCAGSIENFVEMMNQKAANLGCTGSHFANPSGLNDEDHYVTARDMAIITKAAIDNPTFVEIDGALYWTHAPIKHYPDPEDPHNTVYAHHSMLKKNNARYYPGAFAGKTGYTSLAGNTLVTCAEQEGMTLICVILNGHQTHYQDTKTLFDFGFRNFRTLHVAEYDRSYTALENDMVIAGLNASPLSTISLDDSCYITLPRSADPDDVKTSLDYQLDSSAPYGSIARIFYSYGDRPIGSSYLLLKENEVPLGRAAAVPQLAQEETVGIPEPTTRALGSLPDGTAGATDDGQTMTEQITGEEALTDGQDLDDRAGLFHLTSTVWIALALTVLLAAIITITVVIKVSLEAKADRRRYLFNERRKERLQEMGLTRSEFETMVQERKRLSSLQKRNSPPKRSR